MTYEQNCVSPADALLSSGKQCPMVSKPCQVCGWKVYIYFEDSYIDHNPYATKSKRLHEGIREPYLLYIHKHCFWCVEK